ncbi:MAG: serine hydrolase domain-containing protein [Propionibacteriaceae bacterium]
MTASDHARNAMRRRLSALLVCLAITGCSQAPREPSESADVPPPTAASDRAERSQEVLDSLLSADEPGCTAAVGEEGRVVWQGVRGVADLKTAASITPETVVDIGSVSKQFTATALLLLVQDGQLELSDRLADHVDGLPGWSRQTTLEQLMHHTSGIPDYGRLLLDAGYEESERTVQQDALDALAAAPRLEFSPGAQWEYSNSNYLLLAEVIETVSGTTLSRFVAERVFKPLQLDMVIDPVGDVAHKAVSYRAANGSFSVYDSRWEQIGDGAIQTTPSELVRWADNYRTGEVGGEELLRATLADAVDDTIGGGGGRYGAGIVEAPDGSLWHAGAFEGFRTEFWVSADRRLAVALACNASGQSIDTEGMFQTLAGIWS